MTLLECTARSDSSGRWRVLAVPRLLSTTQAVSIQELVVSDIQGTHVVSVRRGEQEQGGEGRLENTYG